ncbi:hypothetical protein [Longimicrobium sp.]
MRTSHTGVPASPMRLLEMLTNRCGVFEALGHAHHQAQPLHQHR